jgi:hypothetical protein
MKVFIMNHQSSILFRALTSTADKAVDSRFLREMTLTSNHMHIDRLSAKFGIFEFFNLICVTFQGIFFRCFDFSLSLSSAVRYTFLGRYRDCCVLGAKLA